MGDFSENRTQRSVFWGYAPCVALQRGLFVLFHPHSEIRIPQLFSPTSFRKLVSGRRHGVAAWGLRALLRVAEVPYAWVVRYRNRRYDRQSAPIHRVGVPVVCVGNLTLGGTGKTPLVEWVAAWFERHAVRVAIVSRGYGTPTGIPNDEAMELRHALPNVPHVQHADRVAAARTALEQHGSQLIVLDDGFQHRRLGRDLDIVLLDASEPFGFEHLFPRGTLREPAGALRRADVVVLSRADMLAPAARDAVRRRVAQLAPDASWCEVVHRPTALVNQAGERLPLEQLRGRRVVAFCGIGNPAGFRHTLQALGCQCVGWREFADHHAYDHDDAQRLQQWATAEEAEIAVCTRKDLVKLKTVALATVPLWAVCVEPHFLRGESELESMLQELASRCHQDCHQET